MQTTGHSLILKNRLMDESFNPELVPNPRVFLQLDESQMLAMVIDPVRNKALALSDYHFPVDEETENPQVGDYFKEILENPDFKNIFGRGEFTLSFHSSTHSLVPNPLFSKDQVGELLSLTCSLQDSERLRQFRYIADPIPSADAHFLYALPESIAQAAEQHFPGVTFRHAASSFIESRLRQNKYEKDDTLSVHIRRRHLDVMISSGSDLKFFNSFRYRTAEDLIYYLLFTMEQLQLNPDTLKVTCYGEIEKISAGWMLARKYIRNLDFGERCESVEYSYGFDKFPGHQYYSLFSQYP